MRADVKAAATLLVRYLRSQGLPAYITSGDRTPKRQAELIAAGLTQATQSRHLTGTAFDIGFEGYKVSQVNPALWLAVGKLGERLGLRWGGRFRDYDPVHFDAG